jgi:carbonic anhydrase
LRDGRQGFVFQVNCDALSGEAWKYEDKGPDYWPVLYKKCSAKRQSPINIIPSDTVYDRNLKPVKVHQSNELLNFEVVNEKNTGK